MNKFFFTVYIVCGLSPIFSQTSLFDEHQKFTRQDSLRGSITPERAWWDLTYYHLDISVNPDKKLIKGKNTIHYKVLKNHNVLQVDLQPPLVIEKVIQDGKELKVTSEENAHFVTLSKKQIKGSINSIDVYYSGNPKEAVRAPWDGGISWKKDSNGKHFVASSCQGLGASVWWPNKDHMYDEVDSMLVSVTVPKGLMNVGNGRLRKVEERTLNTKTFHWFVQNPINNYGVNINIGDYVHFGEQYDGEKGNLDMDYYVLRDNLEDAKKQFKDAPKMMKSFEHWFGPYPFYEDSFKLVEAPYLGMEHQSSVTYGNKYVNGYLGNDLSGTGWGLKFDFIIIHESGHEWFANNITYKDIADMWIHESFTAYSENLFLDYHYGKQASSEYVIGTRQGIRNDKPIIGRYHVNNEGSSDMYYKGANMLHTLRQLIEDDEKWRSILRGLNKDFYHQTVTTKQIEDYLSKKTNIDLTAFFNQYLRDTRIPTLEYSFDDNGLKYRYIDIVEDFDMPVRLKINGKDQWVQPNTKWQTLKVKTNEIVIDPNFYINTKSI
ncbi:M1 family peptidase [Aquimarina sp. AD1]|uniref:M1 family metallopeptidase n=1 Tax=Aquimarina sp. (strain AD1) TaxID=1714848 RepID=UPI000E4DC8EC|nr:M1 family metallopeptidase [Aquimarina sp. AD1]AXT54294.1 M1 family peptidase [Aquimarina sp. AD1]RKN24609.1 M1 family peptidase [Aquimarina sp. AD1]